MDAINAFVADPENLRIAAIALGIGGRDAAKRFVDDYYPQLTSAANGNGRHRSGRKAKSAPRVGGGKD